MTRAVERALSVGTVGVGVTVVCIDQTFMDIWGKGD